MLEKESNSSLCHALGYIFKYWNVYKPVDGQWSNLSQYMLIGCDIKYTNAISGLIYDI